MGDRQTADPRIGTVIVVMAGAVAITPLGLALAADRGDGSAGSPLVIAAAVAWLIVFALYRGFVQAYGRRRRQILRREIAEERRARIETTDAYQDKLLDHDAILERIVEISDAIIEEGIIDPRLTIRNVRLIQAHAADAQILIDDAIIEARVAIGAEEVVAEPINLRDEIERVAAPFARGDIGIATSGPRVWGDTDPAMLRLVLRSLISGAIGRGAEQIDVSVARDAERAVCTVSDDGEDCSRHGLDAVSALATSLAGTLTAEIEFTRALGRNQYSIAVLGAPTPPEADPSHSPIDVIGGRNLQQELVTEQPVKKPAFTPEELITFVRERERNRKDTVAARRERQLTAR